MRPTDQETTAVGWRMQSSGQAAPGPSGIAVSQEAEEQEGTTPGTHIALQEGPCVAGGQAESGWSELWDTGSLVVWSPVPRWSGQVDCVPEAESLTGSSRDVGPGWGEKLHPESFATSRD